MPSRTGRFLDRVVRLALHLYPRSFRERWGEELRGLHLRLGGGGPGGTRRRTALHLVLEALRHGPAARLEYRRRARGTPTPGGRGLGWDAAAIDLRRAGRQLARHPLLSGLLVGTLALGIGSATAIFSVCEQILLRPLPFAEPDRLVRFMGTEEGELEVDGTIAYLDLFDWHERSRVLEGVAAYDEWWPTLAAGGEVERVSAAIVGANYFDLLGLEPVAGRFFLPEEDEDGRDSVVVLSSGLWRRRFARDRGVIGRTLELNGRPHEVVGVAPPFDEPGLAGVDDEPVLWRPNGYGGVAPDELPNRGSESWAGIGRLRRGVTLEQARREVQHVAAALEREFPETNRGRGVALVPLHDQIVGDVRPSLLLLGGAVALLFLVALVNVSGVLLGRVAERARETAVSRALGAGRWALLRRGLVEGWLLASLGSLLGLPCAWIGTEILVGLAGTALPRPVEAGLDLELVAFAALVSVAAGAICGLLPALSSSRVGLGQALRAGADSLTSSRSSVRARAFLVVAEVGLSVVLLFGATLLGVGFLNLLRVDPGLEPENLLTFTITVPRATYPDRAETESFFARLEERLRSLPGVRDVGVSNIVPLSGDFDGNGVWAQEWPVRTLENEVSAQTRSVSPTYFSTMGIKILRGRSFGRLSETDEPEAIISRRLASRLWPGADPIGRRLVSSADESRPARVVGVVGDVKHLSLDETAPEMVYLARSQGLVSWQLRRATLALRTAGAPLSGNLPAAVRRTVRVLDPGLPISDLRTMSELIDRSVSSPRLRALLTLAFGTAALLLTALGTYSVISSAVTYRRKEFAIRLALGARRSRVASGVLAQTLTLVALGVGLGALGAGALQGVLRGLVYGLDGALVARFGAVPVAVLLLASVVATLSPALRASRVAPAAALREG